MEEIVLIKYGELTTKKANRKEFINLLYNNLYNKLKDYNTNIIKEFSRMYIEFDKEKEKDVLDIINSTFGIHAYNIAYKTTSKEEDIVNEVLNRLKDEDFNTFKVVTNRRDKSFPIPSMEFNEVVAGPILKELKKKVDVHSPDIYVNIEINKDDSYIYFNEIKGLGGYPVGVQGKGLLMLSGGIDSPVAGFLSLKRGIKVDAIYFEAIPHTSLAAREKVINLAKKLLKYSSDFNLYVVPITKLQEEIYEKSDPEYVITILRRMMYRIAERIANKNKHLVLINGESIGQVASQTLTSMRVINKVVDIPIIRPVACLDKLEIIDISKKIDTYDISILPYEDCCTIFVPKHPVINPKEDKCVAIEQRINYESMIEDIVNETFIVKIDNKKDYNDLL